MKVLRALAIAAALLLSSCSVVGRYEWNALVVGGSLDLREDHTFTWREWSDQVELERPEPQFTGTWERVGSLTIVTTVESTSRPVIMPIGSAQRWRKTVGGIVRVEGVEFTRSRRESSN